MSNLVQHIESLIFASPRPVSLEDIDAAIAEALGGKQHTRSELEDAIAELRRRYDHVDFSFELQEIAGGYQLMTKPAYHGTIGVHLRRQSTKKLTRSALETLSIVAYRQPVTRGELEKIRGVSCDYALQKLLEKELVTIQGRADSVGKPLLYGVTDKFMDYFGIRSVADLPQPKDFQPPEQSIGEPDEVMVEEASPNS